MTPPAQCRTDIGITVPATIRGEGEVETQLMPAGRYAQSHHIITDRSQYGPRWQEHIGEIVAAGLGCVPKVVEKWPPHFIEPNSSKNTGFIYFKTT